VNASGYARVIINALWITSIFYVLAAGADALDRVVAGRATLPAMPPVAPAAD
jgi:hypothetical protein